MKEKFDMAEWPRLIEHIRDLNSQGYLDHYHEKLKCSFAYGGIERWSAYIHVSITPDLEICITGFADNEKSNAELTNFEGAWETESVWHNDEQVDFTQYCRECGKAI